MKPRLIVLIVALSIVGFVTTMALPGVLLWGVTHQRAARQQLRVGMAPVAVQNDFMVFQQPVWNQNFPVPVAREQLKEIRGPVVAAKDVKISGPFAHANMGVFLIHGPDNLKSRPFITLHDAVAGGQAVVRDRGTVFVENLSNTDLFIQSGDIVKGGNQDRTIEYDHLLPPRSGPVPIAALCVEQGRSGPRGFESSAEFLSAAEQLPTRTLRLANLHRHDQMQVWNGVRQTQANLSRNVGASVRAPLSASSLQLTLENKGVQKAVQSYLDELGPVAEGENDVIGFALTINGKIHSADIYASPALFRTLWPKLVRAGAIEALAERSGRSSEKLPSTQAVQSFLADAAQGTGTRRDVSPQVRLVSQESARSVLFDCCDAGRQYAVIHRCVLAK